MFDTMTICLDMHGCPNRCRHCWLGHLGNGSLREEDLIIVSRMFSPYTQELSVYSWFREPDYSDCYQSLWTLENQLSTHPHSHYELAGFYRLVRDSEYAPWLYDIGVRCVQLTFFGCEDTTDAFIGRKGAFSELLKATEILLDAKIVPRWQIFIYHNNVKELGDLEQIIRNIDLEKRCLELGQDFDVFVHQGSCEGESMKLYENWLIPEDILKIPAYFLNKSLSHFHADSLEQIFGKTEQDLCKDLSNSEETMDFVSNHPVFLISSELDTYPNISNLKPYFRLGNLKTDSSETILNRYRNRESFAQHEAIRISAKELVRNCGNSTSRRLFGMSDYKMYLLNRYCEEFYHERDFLS